jgi:hydroxylaminobenzene mutase
MGGIGRRYLVAGLVVFLLGLLMGFVGPSSINPRAALSGHVATLMGGGFLVALSAVTPMLARWAAEAAFWPQIYSALSVASGYTLAAVWGAGKVLPIAGAGHHADPSHESIVTLLIATGSLAALLAVVILIVGALFPGRARVSV